MGMSEKLLFSTLEEMKAQICRPLTGSNFTTLSSGVFKTFWGQENSNKIKEFPLILLIVTHFYFKYLFANHKAINKKKNK